jgi:hypothetical protein
MDNKTTMTGAVIGGIHYLSRTDVMELYKLSNNKSHRLLIAANMPFIEAYDRRFYPFDEVTTYISNILKK